MRLLQLCFAAAILSACTAATVPLTPATATLPDHHTSECAARDDGLEWRGADSADAVELARWCRAVGRPIVTASTATHDTPPTLDALVTVSWNAHLAEGELEELVARLKAGAFTGGRPVGHFVLLVQELYRRGDQVPPFDPRNRSAFAIKARDLDAPDADDYAAGLGLSMLYVPSMRNGVDLREDRGNAIVSTEPLLDPIALELPLARQRRVALGAAIMVATPRGLERLEVINAHLEPLSSPKTLWVFRNPRGAQVRAILDLLATPRYHGAAGVVWGGDFNTVRGGDREDAYRLARRWATSLGREDARDTHMMGRLDYLFFRLGGGWTAATERLDDRFGSDHYPVLGTFSR